MNHPRKRRSETLAQVHARLASEGEVAYAASPFSALSKDYFSRFSRELSLRPDPSEMEIDSTWTILISVDSHPVTRRMAGHLAEFLEQCMAVHIPIVEASMLPVDGMPHAISLLDFGGGDPAAPESFTLKVQADRIGIHGRDPQGGRDGIVRMANLMGLRQAPFMEIREQVYRPRLSMRIGTLPWLGGCRDLVFMGYNTILLPGATLFELSISDAIPELAARRDPGALVRARQVAAEAEKYGLKTYCWVSTVRKFPKDDPVFLNHPGVRGSLTWKEDGEYILCTEHPLVRRWLEESIAGLFREVPGLWGMGVIIGGEGFYHCFMRPYGAPNGHTTCPRCEELGPDAVVANLCNTLAGAARRVNPDALITAWPYSAEHCWAGSGALQKTIARLGPGTALLTEIEKEGTVEKPGGLTKLAWDYSIDIIGPCQRAKEQVDLCRKHEIPVLMKSEPELAFEASRLADVPCMDRWFARSEALAACGAAGAVVIPAFRRFYATAAAESGLWMWWNPCRSPEWILDRLADRLAGPQAGPELRKAWRLVSEAVAYSPEIPSYYYGPHYLGPAQPMCADRSAELPEEFYGQYLFHAEITDEEGLRPRPVFWKDVSNAPAVLPCYHRMDALLSQAVAEIKKAAGKVPTRCRIPFEAEASQIRWFHHTVRSEVNFYESCLRRNRLLHLTSLPERTPAEVEEGLELCAQWRAILLDELRNARKALPVARADVRLDFYYGGDHTFPHLVDMLRAKIRLLSREIAGFLPSIEQRLN